MTAQVNEFVWKPGRNTNIDFCGNFKRLQEKEPKTAELLLGHFEEEGFQTEDVNYLYKIYHSQYGYSVGRRKKPVFIPNTQPPLTIKVAPITAAEPKKVAIPDVIKNIEDEKSLPMEDSLSFTPSEVRIRKDLAAAISELIKVKH
jgi:hypothetical protein